MAKRGFLPTNRDALGILRHSGGGGNLEERNRRRAYEAGLLAEQARPGSDRKFGNGQITAEDYALLAEMQHGQARK